MADQGILHGLGQLPQEPVLSGARGGDEGDQCPAHYSAVPLLTLHIRLPPARTHGHQFAHTPD